MMAQVKCSWCGVSVWCYSGVVNQPSEFVCTICRTGVAGEIHRQKQAARQQRLHTDADVPVRLSEGLRGASNDAGGGA